MVKLWKCRIAVALLAGATLAAISSCSVTPPPELEALPRVEDYRPSEWDMDRRKVLLDEMATAGRMDDVPDVSVIRWTNPEDNASVIVDCLHGHGFIAQVTDSGFGSNVPDDQWDAYHLALYTCTAQYPVRLDIDRPPSEIEFEAAYWHLTNQFLPCLAREGYAGVAAPSREVYEASMRGDAADPIFVELVNFRNVGDAELLALLEKCPMRPQGYRSHER